MDQENKNKIKYVHSDLILNSQKQTKIYEERRAKMNGVFLNRDNMICRYSHKECMNAFDGSYVECNKCPDYPKNRSGVV